MQALAGRGLPIWMNPTIAIDPSNAATIYADDGFQAGRRSSLKSIDADADVSRGLVAISRLVFTTFE
jgi:hypothetical protein